MEDSEFEAKLKAYLADNLTIDFDTDRGCHGDVDIIVILKLDGKVISLAHSVL